MKNVDRQELTPEYLVSKGYVLDKKETEALAPYEKESYGTEDFAIYYDKSHQICVTRTFNSRYGTDGWSVHVDDDHFESIGWMYIKYVDEFEAFIGIFKEDIVYE